MRGGAIAADVHAGTPDISERLRLFGARAAAAGGPGPGAMVSLRGKRGSSRVVQLEVGGVTLPTACLVNRVPYPVQGVFTPGKGPTESCGPQVATTPHYGPG